MTIHHLPAAELHSSNDPADIAPDPGDIVSRSSSDSDSCGRVHDGAQTADVEKDDGCASNSFYTDSDDNSCRINADNSATSDPANHVNRRCKDCSWRCRSRWFSPVSSTCTTGRRHRLMLSIFDNIVSGLLIGPLTVAFWRGTWTVLDHQLLPGNRLISGWLCFAVGNIGLMTIVHVQDALERLLRRGTTNRRTVDWIIGYHLYTYVMGLLNVFHWRGLWILIDQYTGINPASVWITFAIGQVGLMILRSSRNVLAPPMAVNVDIKPHFFAYSTRFKVERRHREHFFLDSLLTVFVIHQFVIAYWRGLWEALNIHLIPDNPPLSAGVSIAMSYALQAVVLFLEPMFNAVYRQNLNDRITSSNTNESSAVDSRSLPDDIRFRRWILETVIYFVGNAVSVLHWRGYWILFEVFVLPERPTLSGSITNVVGIAGLWVMLAGHSVTQGGCLVDGDSAPEDGCVIPNYYIRFFAVEKFRFGLRKKKKTNESERTTTIENGYDENGATTEAMLTTSNSKKIDSMNNNFQIVDALELDELQKETVVFEAVNCFN